MLSTKLRHKSMLVLLLAASGTPLAGCANNQFATYDGAGAAFPKAEFVVKGKTRYDQTWIDKTIEAEVAGFGFPRPKPRPAYLDAPAAKPVVVVKPPPEKKGPAILLPTPRTEAAPVVTAAPPPKPSLTQRLRLRVRELEEKLKHKGGG